MIHTTHMRMMANADGSGICSPASMVTDGLLGTLLGLGLTLMRVRYDFSIRRPVCCCDVCYRIAMSRKMC